MAVMQDGPDVWAETEVVSMYRSKEMQEGPTNERKKDLVTSQMAKGKKKTESNLWPGFLMGSSCVG
jgi:hypothetical protein